MNLAKMCEDPGEEPDTDYDCDNSRIYRSLPFEILAGGRETILGELSWGYSTIIENLGFRFVIIHQNGGQYGGGGDKAKMSFAEKTNLILPRQMFGRH